jgi:hypothetical protein|tara:strand:+ start:102 stop:560 length:459 start_codon:yes stop_codon:yes gene_type:complete
MIKLASVFNTTGEVSFTMQPVEPAKYPDITEGDETTLVKVSEEMSLQNLDNYTWKIDRDPQWLARSERPAGYYDWNLGTNSWDLNSEALMGTLRQKRDNVLALCDWTQIPDAPLTDSKKAEWATYRQALRDLPANNSSITLLADATWPTQPA